MAETLVSVADVTKDYDTGKVTVRALRGLSLDVAEGDFMAIVGPSLSLIHI